MEVYNADKDENFRKYTDTLLALKMVEVCSTTLPQYVLPEIYESSDYKNYLKQRIEKYQKRADLAEKIFSSSKELKIIKPK
jgi:aspartate/methionine/tyrosine aminotransferase